MTHANSPHVSLPPIPNSRPYVLSVAGLDPSAGAGLLADNKVFETLGVYGLGICTALTRQHDAAFQGVDWVPFATIRAQGEPLVERYPIAAVKVGLIESLAVLSALLNWLDQVLPSVPIVWDPILRASAGFDFHPLCRSAPLTELISRVALITPNVPEACQLTGIPSAWQAAEVLSQYCPVYLKGGHAEPVAGVVTDYLLVDGQTSASFPAPFVVNGEKHGSGCVLSAALTAELAGGHSLLEAASRARQYMQQYLQSSPTLLGFHCSFHQPIA